MSILDRFTKPFYVLILFGTIALLSCKKEAISPFHDNTKKDTTINYISWTHLDSIYPNGDSIILASYQLSDSLILLATQSGISYFNTYKNSIDSFIPLNTSSANFAFANMNKYVTIYSDYKGLRFFDNKNLGKVSTNYNIGSFFFPLASLQNNRIYYQYDLISTGTNTGLWKLKSIDFNIDSSNNSSSYVTKTEENEIDIPLTDSFRLLQGVINYLWSFDSSLYTSYDKYFYRINHDGSYKRLTWNGKDLYPNNMFKVGGTLFALSNAYILYSKHLFYSNDNGDSWQQYPNNDDYLDYNFVQNSLELYLDHQAYLYGGWGAFCKLSYQNDKITLKNLVFNKIFVLNINAIYTVSYKYIYATSRSGIWILNKSAITDQ